MLALRLILRFNNFEKRCEVAAGIPSCSTRFLGIVIGMFFNEHGVAHFHAVYGEHEITVELETGDVHGEFPGRALRDVLDWTELHRAELLEDWLLARQGQPLKRIAPLE